MNPISLKSQKSYTKTKSETEKIELNIDTPKSHVNTIESIYEINIQERNSFDSKASSYLSDQEKLAIANVFPWSLEKEKQDNRVVSGTGFKSFANPLIEARE